MSRQRFSFGKVTARGHMAALGGDSATGVEANLPDLLSDLLELEFDSMMEQADRRQNDPMALATDVSRRRDATRLHYRGDTGDPVENVGSVDYARIPQFARDLEAKGWRHALAFGRDELDEDPLMEIPRRIRGQMRRMRTWQGRQILEAFQQGHVGGIDFKDEHGSVPFFSTTRGNIIEISGVAAGGYATLDQLGEALDRGEEAMAGMKPPGSSQPSDIGPNMILAPRGRTASRLRVLTGSGTLPEDEKPTGVMNPYSEDFDRVISSVRLAEKQDFYLVHAMDGMAPLVYFTREQRPGEVSAEMGGISLNLGDWMPIIAEYDITRWVTDEVVGIVLRHKGAPVYTWPHLAVKVVFT